MKYLNRSLILILFFTSLSFTAEAQFIKKLQNAANRGMEKAIEEKVEKEANKMMEAQLEKQFSEIFGEDGESAPVSMDMEKVMKGMQEDVNTMERYDFSGYLLMEMTPTDKKGKQQDKTLIKSYLSEFEDFTAMDIVADDKPNTETTMIFDMKNGASIILLNHDNQKSSMAMKLDSTGINPETEDMLQDKIVDADFTVKETGNTKDILGYACKEYQIKSDDGEGLYWMTDEPIGGYSAFWGTNNPFAKNNTQANYAQHLKNMPQGNFMELYYTATEGDKFELKVIEVKESEPKSFIMAEYPSMFAAAMGKK
ncbi:DUF4412 domain-containing protein [Algoriphagus chordae]|nr:DUF4412 domain-containing protein [Algoriphagus chordae]